MKRKMMARLIAWKNKPDHAPAVIRGLRQVGKTYVAKKFAEENYENAFFLDFRKKPKLGSLFEGDFSINNLMRLISALPEEDRLIQGSKMVPYKTILIFDEVQDCPNARSCLRYFKEDGRFDVICTGSMLGVSGFRVSKKPSRGNPVGSEELLTMTAMDFEEFSWALGVEESVLDLLKECFDEEKAIPDFVHQQMLDIVKQYIVIGGLPAVVKDYIASNDVAVARERQKQILEDYKSDFGTHLNDDGELYTDELEKARVLQVVQSIPKQLAKENNKFQYASLGHGARRRSHEGALDWLEGYGLIAKCNNLNQLEQPFSFYEEADQFKVFLTDIGLLLAMLGDEVPSMVMLNSLGMGKGPIYENLIAEAFFKLGKELYYFSKSSGLEIDFITTLRGKTTLVEAKAKEGRTKAAKEVLTNPSYPVDQLLKLTAQNLGRAGNILTVPYYLAFYALSK